MENRLNIQIEPRYVKEEGDLRPFQRETLEVIKDTSGKIVEVEAPVGAGKSYIIRRLVTDDSFKNKPIVLTYPTKILMDTQIKALKECLCKEIKEVAIWPDDEEKFPVDKGINIFKYSSDSLTSYFLGHPDDFEAFKTRGELLKGGLFQLTYGQKRLFVTTPDVLWLIYSMQYRSASMLQAQLNSAFVFFDEFHTYANLDNFYILLENLIGKSKVDKVILLSATPFVRQEAWAKFEKSTKNQVSSVSFKNSIGASSDKIFNYPLELNLQSFKYTDRKLWLDSFNEILSQLHHPTAIIFDSIFRLKHLKPEIEKLTSIKIREWSGMSKDEDVPDLVKDQEDVIVLGTSAIEVGIDMKFRSLITEVPSWVNAIQRIGRVGRMPYLVNSEILANKGFVYLFVNSKDTFNCLKSKEIFDRDSFEDILRDTLPDPNKMMIGGELFRGKNYNFILIDRYFNSPVVYSEAIFSMYEVDESQCKYFWGDDKEKAKILRDCGVREESLIRELILRDKLFPIWGIVVSNGLKNSYDRILKVEEEKKPKGVTVYTESNPAGFHFYKEKFTSSYLEQSPW